MTALWHLLYDSAIRKSNSTRLSLSLSLAVGVGVGRMQNTVAARWKRGGGPGGSTLVLVNRCDVCEGLFFLRRQWMWSRRLARDGHRGGLGNVRVRWSLMEFV